MMVLPVGFWVFVYFVITVSIVALFLVRHYFTVDPDPVIFICENCSCQDFDHVKEDDNYHHVPYGCAYDVKVCRNCGNRTV